MGGGGGRRGCLCILTVCNRFNRHAQHRLFQKTRTAQHMVAHSELQSSNMLTLLTYAMCWSPHLEGSWYSFMRYAISFKTCSSSSQVLSGAAPPLLLPMLIAPLVGWNRKPISLVTTSQHVCTSKQTCAISNGTYVSAIAHLKSCLTLSEKGSIKQKKRKFVHMSDVLPSGD